LSDGEEGKSKWTEYRNMFEQLRPGKELFLRRGKCGTVKKINEGVGRGRD